MSEQRVLRGDCLRAMRLMEPGSFDAVVTDQPYGLSAEPKPRRSRNGQLRLPLVAGD